jgi:hypothetical protein
MHLPGGRAKDRVALKTDNIKCDISAVTAVKILLWSSAFFNRVILKVVTSVSEEHTQSIFILEMASTLKKEAAYSSEKSTIYNTTLSHPIIPQP